MAGTTGTAGANGAAGAGTAGAGVDAGDPCAGLQDQYAAALTSAKQCDPGGGGHDQCQQLVNTTLPCPNCKAWVNDTTALEALEQKWTDASCAQAHPFCAAFVCALPAKAMCSQNKSGGGGTCVSPSIMPVPIGN